jgi:hypothetical protein
MSTTGAGASTGAAPPSPSEAMPPVPVGRAWISVVLAWVFPGLGHAYLGRRRTALVYAVVVTAMFVLGLSFEGRLYTIESGQPLSILATFAVWGTGLLNIAARMFSDNPGGAVLSVTYEYGCAYLLTAGLMNLLLMLDAYDIAIGRKR